MVKASHPLYFPSQSRGGATTSCVRSWAEHSSDRWWVGSWSAHLLSTKFTPQFPPEIFTIPFLELLTDFLFREFMCPRFSAFRVENAETGSQNSSRVDNFPVFSFLQIHHTDQYFPHHGSAKRSSWAWRDSEGHSPREESLPPKSPCPPPPWATFSQTGPGTTSTGGGGGKFRQAAEESMTRNGGCHMEQRVRARMYSRVPIPPQCPGAGPIPHGPTGHLRRGVPYRHLRGGGGAWNIASPCFWGMQK